MGYFALPVLIRIQNSLPYSTDTAETVPDAGEEEETSPYTHHEMPAQPAKKGMSVFSGLFAFLSLIFTIVDFLFTVTMKYTLKLFFSLICILTLPSIFAHIDTFANVNIH